VREGNDYRIEDAQVDMEWLLSQLNAAWAYIRILRAALSACARPRSPVDWYKDAP